MTTLQRPSADISPRKRSFDLTTIYYPSSRPRETVDWRDHGSASDSVTVSRLSDSEASSPKRRSIAAVRSSSMPVHIASVMSTSYPSFMSVYGSDELSTDKDVDQAELPEEQKKDHLSSLAQLNTHTSTRTTHTLPFAIQHRGSITSLATASTESSPTTTHSIFDSPIMTDASPSSSPESASSNPPLTLFKPLMQPSVNELPRTRDQTLSLPTLHPLQPSEAPAPDSPNNHAITTKNVKNLSLNMTGTILPRPSTSSGLEGLHNFSAPTSPLKEPSRSGRRKPNNLTIRTPGFQQLTFSKTTPEIPPTPSSRPSLQHFQSSPSLPSLATPTTSSSGGLHLSLPPFINGHSRPGSDSSFSSQSVNGALPELKEEEEHAQPLKSQETQEKGYPAGPIQIYDVGVYLYLEPTLEEASDFDTVINVAKEIKNPFEKTSAEHKTVMSIWRGEAERATIPEPQTAISEKSFKSAWEFQPAEVVSPTTPRPASAQRKEPEYLHVPWDHNSEILDDLYPLCRLIDDRVKQNHKVLIHCQLGVSRSASLVIAYGLYKGYQPDFHSMYMQVKSRSQWVGPNMSLIYQLTDFRSKVAKGTYSNGGIPASAAWFKNRPVDSTALKTPDVSTLSLENRNSPSVADRTSDTSRTPHTARPLPPMRLNKDLPPVPLFPKDDPKPLLQSPTMKSTIAAVSQSLANVARLSDIHSGVNKPSTEANRAITRPLPFRELVSNPVPAPIPPHRPRAAAPQGLLLDGPRSPKMDLANQDVPATPSMFSPRAMEFMNSPFAPTSAGDLAINGLGSAQSVRSIPPPDGAVDDQPAQVTETSLPTTVDPRSPHQQSEGGEILRHIDEFL